MPSTSFIFTIISKGIKHAPQRFFFWRLLPLLGSVLFLLLYVVASLYYPGGTYENKSSKGFSWIQNYWCNLLSENAINGQYNPARPIAFIAMAVIACTLTIFWFLFPVIAGFKRRERHIVQASGFMAMGTALFIFTTFHDTIINIAGLFGLIALTGTLVGLKRLGWRKLFYMGLCAVLLIAVNNLLYQQKSLMYYLPVIQKITFFYFLMWISCINIYWLAKPLKPS